MSSSPGSRPATVSALVEALRPSPVSLNEDWKRETLDSIVASPLEPAPSRRSYRPKVVAAVAACMVLAAGAAYAGGLVPQYVQDAFTPVVSEGTGNGPWGLHRPVMIANLALPGEQRFVVWRGTNDQGGQCEAAGVITNDAESGDLAITCSSWDPIVGDGARAHAAVITSVRPDGNDPSDEVTVLYGDSPMVAATHVHITGAEMDLDLEIDAETRGFAVVLPDGTDPSADLSARYMSEGNVVLRSDRVVGG